MLPDEPPATTNALPLTVTGLTDLAAEGKAQVKASYHEGVAVGITLVITGLGYAWGMVSDPKNFVRVGELIIVIGILFAGLDLTGRLSLVDEWVKTTLERIRPVALPAWSRREQEQAQAKVERREVLEDHVASGIKHATDMARARLRFIEISILILGSLICGFGDMVVVHWRS